MKSLKYMLPWCGLILLIWSCSGQHDSANDLSPAPLIRSVSTDYGGKLVHGMQVVLEGDNFNPNASKNRVVYGSGLGATEYEVLEASENRIVFDAPYVEDESVFIHVLSGGRESNMFTVKYDMVKSDSVFLLKDARTKKLRDGVVWTSIYKVFRKIETLPIPVIAAVNGFALGGGCELAMSCDIRICSTNARFGQPEVGLGIVPGFSGTYRLTKLVGMGMAKQLIFTGKPIKADEALRIGLVNAVYEQAELMNEAIKMAESIIANAPLAVSFAKECINEEYDLCADEAIAYETKLFGKCFATQDQKDGMKAFLNKEKVEFQGK